MQIYIIEALLLVFLIITTVCVIFCKDILCAAVIYSECSFCAVLLYLMMGRYRHDLNDLFCSVAEENRQVV